MAKARADTERHARSIGEAVVYSGAAVAEIAAGNLAYATTHYGVSWCAPALAWPVHACAPGCHLKPSHHAQ